MMLTQWFEGLIDHGRDLKAIKKEPNRQLYELKMEQFVTDFTAYLSEYPGGEDGVLNEKAILLFVNADGRIAKRALYDTVLFNIFPSQKDIDALAHPELQGHGPMVDSAVESLTTSHQVEEQSIRQKGTNTTRKAAADRKRIYRRLAQIEKDKGHDMDAVIDEIQSTIQKQIDTNPDDQEFKRLFKGKVPIKKTIKKAISDLFE